MLVTVALVTDSLVTGALRGGRPGPAAPAKAWAIPIHCVAVSPVMTRPVSLRCRRWVTTRQKSSAVPLTRSAAVAGPQAHSPPSGAASSTRTGASGCGSPWTE